MYLIPSKSMHNISLNLNSKTYLPMAQLIPQNFMQKQLPNNSTLETTIKMFDGRYDLEL